MPDPSPQPDKINRLLEAVYPSFALIAGMQLDLFTPLASGPLSSEKLASAIGVKESKLRPLLYALAVVGLLTVEEGSFSNTPEADHYLVRGKSGYIGEKSEVISTDWGRMLRMAETIRLGRPPADYDDYTAEEGLEYMFRGLDPGAVRDANRLMELFDFSGRHALLDLGGGSGGLAITIAQANPNLNAVVFDLPTVTPITKRFIEQAGAGDQVEVVSGDAVDEPIPGSYDAVAARGVLQVLSAEQIRSLLKNIAAAVAPGGFFHVIGWVLDDTRQTPENTVGYNLILLTSCVDGQAYTEGEYRGWLAEAGFVDFHRFPMPNGVSFLSVRKPD
jgi:SAM-dependent methyltransferase